MNSKKHLLALVTIDDHQFAIGTFIDDGDVGAHRVFASKNLRRWIKLANLDLVKMVADFKEDRLIKGTFKLIGQAFLAPPKLILYCY